jgi:hypothetical protein
MSGRSLGWFRPVDLLSGQCSLVMAGRQAVMSALEALVLAGIVMHFSISEPCE